MSIVTKQGDYGETLLANGERVVKHDSRIRTLAALDELNAALGLVKTYVTRHTPSGMGENPVETLERLQHTLMAIMSVTAGYAEHGESVVAVSHTATRDGGITDRHFSQSARNTNAINTQTAWLEECIDSYERLLPPQKDFVLYGASTESAALHHARAVARRAEVELSGASVGQNNFRDACVFMNRLSDFLYVWARYIEFEQEIVSTVCAVFNKGQTVETVKKVAYGIDLSLATRMIECIEHQAAVMNLAVAIAVCNAQGNPIALHVMDGALLIAHEVATAKAYTASALRMPTEKLHELTQPGAMFYSLESLHGGKLCAIAGGVPLLDGGGQLLGGLGVSGGTAEQDASLGAHGVAVFEQQYNGK